MGAYEIRFYLEDDGGCPFTEWLENLRDREARARVKVRLDRLERGNFGDSKSVGEGVFELRISHGPGYRVYFGREGDIGVVILSGGSKKDQEAEIQEAKGHWRRYKGVKRSEKADA